MSAVEARTTPAVRQSPPQKKRSTAPRRKKKRRAWVVLGFGYVVAMGLSLVMISRGAQVAEERAAITRVRQELAALEKQNQNLEARLMKAVSVAEVEHWAEARGMQRAETVNTVAGDPSAVARPEVQAAAEEPADDGLLASVGRYFRSVFQGGFASH